MAKHDELDEVLNDPRMTDEDFGYVCEVLEIKPVPPAATRIEDLNKEIRHNYGHTFLNIWRDCYSPDYQDIIKGTAEKLKIQVRDHNTVEELEDKILAEIIEQAREQFIKKNGEEAWKEIEASLEKEVTRLINEGKIPKAVADQFKNLRGGALIAAIVGGRMAGFALYILVNQVFFAIARWMGVAVGVAVAGPIIGRLLSMFLGPIGWILAGLIVIYDLGNTNWRKVIPSVALVIMLRRRFKYGEEGTELA